MIDVSDLTKTYGDHAAVRGLTFSVGQGEVVGFLGPNGAGKSTTLRMLAGFLGMTSGSIRIAGHDIVTAPLEARASIGYMPEATPLYGEMRVAEYLRFRAELKGVARGARASAVFPDAIVSMPAIGSQRSCTAKTTLNTSPSQKPGTA